MGKMVKILAAVLAFCLLCGCNGVSNTNGSENAETVSPPENGFLKVYAESGYRYALQQVFSHINMSDSSLEILWTGEKNSADVVITDYVPIEEYGDYMVLNTQKLSAQGMEQLLLRTDRGVIGLPVFLHLDGFWYDQWLYQENNATVPQSKNTWSSCELNGEYPAVCDKESMEALFWGVVAPLYLSCGGTEQELITGQLQKTNLQSALEQVRKMLETKQLILTGEARQTFTSSNATFWIAGVEQLSRSYNYQSNLSTWNISLSLPFEADEKTECVVRADMLLIRNTADPSLAERFIELFYDEKILTDLSENTKMPMACRMRYSPSEVPEMAQICHTALSSPTAELHYVICGWEEGKQEKVYSALLQLMQGKIDSAQTADLILQ